MLSCFFINRSIERIDDGNTTREESQRFAVAVAVAVSQGLGDIGVEEVAQGTTKFDVETVGVNLKQ